MTKEASCSVCGFKDCVLAYTGEPHPLCCDCWQKSGASEVAECFPCEDRRLAKERILRQQTKLTDDLTITVRCKELTEGN